MFDAPEGNDPVAIGLGSMGKGQAWVNGHLIGRYWSIVAPESGCPSSCNYAGTYGDSKCRSNCGMATQSWYKEKISLYRTCFISRLFSCHALLPLLFNTWQHISYRQVTSWFLFLYAKSPHMWTYRILQ